MSHSNTVLFKLHDTVLYDTCIHINLDEIATSKNNYSGCHPNHGIECSKQDLNCYGKVSTSGNSVEIETSSEPDHNAWILEHNSHLRFNILTVKT